MHRTQALVVVPLMLMHMLYRPNLVHGLKKSLNSKKNPCKDPIIFFKFARSTGPSCKGLGAHTQWTQRRQGCPNSLGTRHTEALTPHTRTHPHARLSTQWESWVEQGSNPRPAAPPPGAQTARATARSLKIQSCAHINQSTYSKMNIQVERFNLVHKQMDFYVPKKLILR